MELFPQSLNDVLPVQMAREALPRCAADAVLGVEAHVERIVAVTAGGDGNSDAVAGYVRVVRVLAGLGLGLGLVELEADLGQVIQFGDSIPCHLCGEATFDDAVEQGVNVRL